MNVTAMENCDKCSYHILKEFPEKMRTATRNREYYCAESGCFLRHMTRCPLSGKSINPVAISLQ